MARRSEDGSGSEFDRDFGYLLPFLQKVAAAAQSLTGPAREELLSLVEGEPERWARIRELLGGAQGTVRESGGDAPSPESEGVRPQFTIGPLKGG